MERYRDRRHAGRVLAAALAHYAGESDVTVLALPRGGVPVGYEVARRLGVPLDVFVVRKLGVPGREELAMGAIASGGVRVLDDELVRELGVPGNEVAAVTAWEERELQQKERVYRDGRPPPIVRGRTIILVDDGLATGSSMRAAVAGLRRQYPAHIAVAVPVASALACEELSSLVDDLICAITPEPLISVGAWYEDFSQVTDQDVRALLEAAARQLAQREGAPASPGGP